MTSTEKGHVLRRQETTMTDMTEEVAVDGHREETAFERQGTVIASKKANQSIQEEAKKEGIERKST